MFNTICFPSHFLREVSLLTRVAATLVFSFNRLIRLHFGTFKIMGTDELRPVFKSINRTV
jgi:hypothetical protein